MTIDDFDELIQIEAEQLSETLLGSAYFDLTTELQLWVRGRAIEALWPEPTEQELVAAA